MKKRQQKFYTPEQGEVSRENYRPKEKFFSKEKRFNIEVSAMNERQAEYIDCMKNNVITIAYGSAGTGKSCLAATYAMQQITQQNYDKLILCRANVPTGRTLGAFPGTVEEKLLPWLSHIIGYCKDTVGNGVVQSWMRSDHPKIIMEPIETIRGRSYNNAIILIEEAQQLTFEELKAITTRIGYNTKMILTGDPAQRDTKTTALEDFISIMHKHNISGFGAIKFTSDDIVRSNIVKELIIAFEKEGV